MKVISLFDGISCARVALERANIKVDSYFACEIDKYAISVSQKNYPDIYQSGSVTDFNAHLLDDIDILIGGSPCQDLSIAGNRKGLQGERSGLFWEYVRILNECKPKYFVLENVASMSKDAKQTISDALYGIEPVMINAALVSAQNRKRFFWVGKLQSDGTYKQVSVEQPKDKNVFLRDIIDTGENTVYQDTYKRMEGAPREHNDKCFTLTAAMGTGGGHVPYVKPVALRNRGEGKKPEYNDTQKANSMTTVQTDSMVEVDSQIRKLSPVECERLQGLPDNYTEGVSNTQRYKSLGNAFNVDVVAHILSHFK